MGLDKLTKREKNVADLLVQGMTNKKIGQVLGITERTVKGHRGTIFKKLGIKSIVDLVYTIPAMTWRTDRNGHNEFTSDELLAFYGKTREAMLRDGWVECMHPSSRQMALDNWQKIWHSKTTHIYPYYARRADDNYVWILSVAIPLFDASGEYTGHHGLIIEIDPYITRWLRLLPELS